MPGRFGTAEANNILTIQETYAQAISQGYMAQLQAYGVGRGLTQQEAEQRAIENLGMNIHPQQAETFKKLKRDIDSARTQYEREQFLNYENNAVSTGANNVKSEAPASAETEVATEQKMSTEANK